MHGGLSSDLAAAAGLWFDAVDARTVPSTEGSRDLDSEIFWRFRKPWRRPITVLTVREKNQVTIPRATAQAVGIEPGTTFDIQYVNGVITLTLSEHRKPGDSLEQHAGIGKGLWGLTNNEIAESLEDDRDTWER